MRVYSKSTLRKFWEANPDSEAALKVWHDIVAEADWKTPNDVKQVYAAASIVGDGKVVFNIKGNHYRLLVAFAYEFSTVFILWIGPHKDYDKINVHDF